MSYGAQTKLGVARQAAANSAVITATSYHALGYLSEDVGLEKQEVISQNLNGRFDEGATYSGPANVAGTLALELTPRSLGAALAMVVNHSPVSVSSGAIRTLTFLPTTTDFSSTLVKAPWSMYKQWTDADSGELFLDLQPTELQFRIAQGAFNQASVRIAGGSRAASGIGSLSVVPDANDIKTLFPWNVASISYGGAGVQNYSDLTVTVNENIEPLYANNATLTPYKYTRNGFRQVTAAGNMYFADRTLLNNFAADTSARLLVTMINTTAAIQSGYYNTLLIDIPQFKVTQFKPSTSGPGEVAVPVAGRGTLDPSSAYSIQFTLTTTWQGGF